VPEARGRRPSAEELLEAAARGRVGVDRRFVQAVLDSGDAAGVLCFARASHENDRIELEPLLIDLFRYFQTPEALEFYVDVIRRAPEEVDDSLIQALLPFGAKAVEPLLALYDQLDEEQGSDVAFLLATLRLRDPRVFQVLLDRLEYDAADGAFCLGLYGDPAARPALEKMLAEIPESEQALRREITHAVEQLDAPEPDYQPEPFDILADYPQRELPPFDVLDEAERIEMLSSTEPDVRAGAAHSFFNHALNAKSRAALFDLAKSDSDKTVRGEAWAALGDAVEDAAIREAMIAALNDPSKPVEERGGAAVGLYAIADRDDVRQGLEALYEMGGKARIKALEAMWRSLWEPYAKYFPPHLDDKDPKLLRQAIRGAGYFRLTRYADKIAGFFDREEPFDDLREDALFAYALAMPGETTRGRARGLLRKIDALAGLSQTETQLVMFALDERLRLHGLAPVFEGGQEEHEHELQPEPATPAPPQKIGRNDPCPCGSGKKYKKCHGA
jgi:SEC-C motif